MQYTSQISVLLFKNFLIKKYHLGDTIAEWVIPLAIALGMLTAELILITGERFDTLEIFKRYMLFFSALPLLSGNCTRFILNQVVKERQNNIVSNLLVMNLSSSAYGLSFLLTQLPLCLFTCLVNILQLFKLNLSYADMGVMCAVLFASQVTLMLQALVISCLFSNARKASLIGFLVLFLPMVPYHMMSRFTEASSGQPLALSWLPGVQALVLFDMYLFP